MLTFFKYKKYINTTKLLTAIVYIITSIFCYVMWFHRRMLHIYWKDHVTNDEVLRRGRTERKLMNRIRAGQMSFLGHIMRKHGLENIVVTGKIEGERSRGRPRLNFMKSLSQLLKISEVEIIERTRNREEWKTMTANVRIGYGT